MPQRLTKDEGNIDAGILCLQNVRFLQEISRVPCVQAGADDGDGVVRGLLLVAGKDRFG